MTIDFLSVESQLYVAAADSAQSEMNLGSQSDSLILLVTVQRARDVLMSMA